MIFFDLDDTLLDHSKAARFAAAEFHGRFASSLAAGVEDFVALWERLIEKYTSAYARGEIGWVEQRRLRIREVFQATEPHLSDEEADARFAVYLEAYEKNWALFPDVEPCLDALQDHALGIITNGMVLQQTKKLETLRIRDRFSTVVISDAVGAPKPDPRIFLEACRLAGRRPEECIYVGDRLDTDARAACAVGMKGVWIDRLGAGISGPADVAVIRTLADLPPLAGSW